MMDEEQILKESIQELMLEIRIKQDKLFKKLREASKHNKVNF